MSSEVPGESKVEKLRTRRNGWNQFKGRKENGGLGSEQGNLGWQVGSVDRQDRQGKVLTGSAAVTQ